VWVFGEGGFLGIFSATAAVAVLVCVDGGLLTSLGMVLIVALSMITVLIELVYQ